MKMLEVIRFLESNFNNFKNIKNVQDLEKILNDLKIEISKENMQIHEGNSSFSNFNYMGNFPTMTNQLPIINRNNIHNSMFMNQNFSNPNSSNYFSQNLMQMQNNGLNINNNLFSKFNQTQSLSNYNNFPIQNSSLFNEREFYNKTVNEDSVSSEKKAAKEKFYALKEKNNKRFFQVVYMFKNK
jgi:hypothetical protein